MLFGPRDYWLAEDKGWFRGKPVWVGWGWDDDLEGWSSTWCCWKLWNHWQMSLLLRLALGDSALFPTSSYHVGKLEDVEMTQNSDLGWLANPAISKTWKCDSTLEKLKLAGTFTKQQMQLRLLAIGSSRGMRFLHLILARRPWVVLTLVYWYA